LARLGTRLDHALGWIARRKDLSGVPTGLLGSRAGGAAALIAAARDVRPIVAAVSCGGCLDLAAPWLEKVQAPTLLVVAEADGEVLRHNGAALRALRCQKRLEVIPRTTWLFEEPGALASVSAHAAAWFCRHLARAGHP
jgi:dienelactone hydrolase